METIDHIFVGCSELIDIWRYIAIWWDVHFPDHFTITDFMSWSNSSSMRVGQRKVFDAIVISTFLCLWNFKNTTVSGTTILQKSLIFNDVLERTFFGIPIGVVKV